MVPFNHCNRRERRAFRMSVIPFSTARFGIKVGDVNLTPLVDELGIGGARLISVKHFDCFYEGQVLEAGTLPLEANVTINLSAVVRWKKFPRIGIQFVEMAEREKDRLFGYLFKASRQSIRIERAKKANIFLQ